MLELQIIYIIGTLVGICGVYFFDMLFFGKDGIWEELDLCEKIMSILSFIPFILLIVGGLGLA